MYITVLTVDSRQFRINGSIQNVKRRETNAFGAKLLKKKTIVQMSEVAYTY